MSKRRQYFLVVAFIQMFYFLPYAQTNENSSQIIDNEYFCETVSSIFKEYPIQFANVKGPVSYQSSAIVKWESRTCIPNAVECLVSSNKVPKEAIYWRCKILQVDSIDEARSLMVRLVDRITKCSRPFTAVFESSEPIPQPSEITDSHIHVLKCVQQKDVRFKDLIVAVSMVREKSIGKWSLVVTIGKTEYEF